MSRKRNREKLSVKNPLFTVDGNKDNVTLLGYNFDRNIEYSLYKKSRIDVRKIGDGDMENVPSFVYKKYQKYYNYKEKCISYYDSVSAKQYGLEYDAEYEDDNVRCLRGKNVAEKSIEKELSNNNKYDGKSKRNQRKRMRVSRKHHHGNQLDPRSVLMNNEENNTDELVVSGQRHSSIENKRKDCVTVKEVFSIPNAIKLAQLKVYKNHSSQRKEETFADLIKGGYDEYLEEVFDESYEEDFEECIISDNDDLDGYYKSHQSKIELALNQICQDESKRETQIMKKLKRQSKKPTKTRINIQRNLVNEESQDLSSSSGSWTILDVPKLVEEKNTSVSGMRMGEIENKKYETIPSVVIEVCEMSLERDLDELLRGEIGYMWGQEGIGSDETILMLEMTQKDVAVGDKCMLVLENIDDHRWDKEEKKMRKICVTINDARSDLRGDKWKELVDDSREYESLGDLVICVRSILDQHEPQVIEETIGSYSSNNSLRPRFMELFRVNNDAKFSEETRGAIPMKIYNTKKLFQECKSEDEFQSSLLINYNEDWRRRQLDGLDRLEKRKDVIDKFMKYRVSVKMGNVSNCVECVVCRDEYSHEKGEWVRVDYGMGMETNQIEREVNNNVQKRVWYRLCKICGVKGVCYDCAGNLLLSSTQTGYRGQQEITCDDCQDQEQNSIMQMASLPSLLSTIPLHIYYSCIKRRLRLPGHGSVLHDNTVTSCGYCRANLIMVLPSISANAGDLFNCAYCLKRALCVLCGLQGPHWPTDCTQSGKLHRKIRMLGDDTINPLPPSQISIHGMKCPVCDWFVTKNGGCPHMTCICGANFCWNCGDLAAEHGTNFPCNKIKIRLDEHDFSSSDLILTPSSERSKFYCQTFEMRSKQHPNFLNKLYRKILFIHTNLIISPGERKLEIIKFKDNYISLLRIQESLMLKLSLLKRKSQAFEMNYYKRIFKHIQYYINLIWYKVDDIDHKLRKSVGHPEVWKLEKYSKSVTKKQKSVMCHQQTEWRSLMKLIEDIQQFIQMRINK